MKRLLLLLGTICATLTVSGQEWLWEVSFRYRFDNREYGHSMDEPSETIYGARLAPRIGIGFGDGHAIFAGAGLPLDFGSKTFYRPPVFTAWYQYTDEKTGIYMGYFPRSKQIGDYSGAFFSDATWFRDAWLEGALFTWKGENGSVEFCCDWNGLYSVESREKFMLFSAGELKLGRGFSLGYNGMMYHYAQSAVTPGVVDNALAYPYLRWTSKMGERANINIRAGWIQSYQRDRMVQDKPILNGGIEVEAKVEWRKLWIRNVLYAGESLMPLYDCTDGAGAKYGGLLYFGEGFYRMNWGKTYDRIEWGWNVFRNRWLNAQVSTSVHLDGSHIGWQQMVGVSIYLHNK